MKLTRMQLRKLILENVLEGKTEENTAEMQMAHKKRGQIELAKLINKALKGSLDTGSVSGVLKGLGLGFLSPTQYGTDEKLLEAVFERIADIGSANENNMDFIDICKAIGEQYKRLFQSSMAADLKADLNENDINNIEAKAEGFRDFLENDGYEG